MLVHRLQSWPNIDPIMGQCLVFADIDPDEAAVNHYSLPELLMILNPCNVPLESEGAKLLLCKVAVKYLLTPRERYFRIQAR